MHPTIQMLNDILAGRPIKGASDELHMAFMHHGDFETGSWSGIFDAQTAADLLYVLDIGNASCCTKLRNDLPLILEIGLLCLA